MKQIQLVWTEDTRARSPVPEAYFMLAPGLGLTDADLHRMTNTGWQNMQATGDGAAASLAVAPQADAQSLQDAIELIATRGGYKTVTVTIRKL
jgi:hypothetical protein